MGRRATADVGYAQTVMELPQLRNLTFSSLPYDTHPIDMYDGPQGWGPFYGPWTPWDFRDPAADIAYSYGNGESNAWQFAPDYDIVTLFGDSSLDYVWNTSYGASMEQAQEEQHTSYSSTIANVVPNDSGNSFIGRLAAMLRPQQAGG